MRRFFATFAAPALLGAALAPLACLSAPADETASDDEAAALDTVYIGGSELSDARYVVDLRVEARWVFTAAADELPLDRVDVIAPDGTTELLQEWLSRESEAAGEALAGDGPFLLQPSLHRPDELLSALEEQCYLICRDTSNGAQVCRLPCDLGIYAPIFADGQSDKPPPPEGHEQVPGDVDPPDEDPSAGGDSDPDGSGDTDTGSGGTSGGGGSSQGGGSGGGSSSGSGGSGGSAGGGAGNPGW